jgi:hypothetical protein
LIALSKSDAAVKVKLKNLFNLWQPAHEVTKVTGSK